jgi:hypothetical protein
MDYSLDIKILELLHAATDKGLMVRLHSGEDQFSSALGHDNFDIEIIHLQRSQEECYERALVRITGRSIYHTYAIGTTGYEKVMDILRLSVNGWLEGSEGAARKLESLKARIEKEIAQQASSSNGGQAD